MRNFKLCAALVAAGLLAPQFAFAGVDGSTGKIQSAISSGSVDSIVAELERAEYIPTSGAFPAVLQLIDHSSDRVREAAGWWLGRRGVRAQVITLAQQRLAGQDPVAAAHVLDALRGMRDASTLDLIGGFVAHPIDETSGVAALVAVAAIGSPKGLAVLTPALTSPLNGVRAQALRTVRGLRAPVGQKVITTGSAYVPMLKDADEIVRREAALTLAFLGQGGLNADAASAGVNDLIVALQSDSSARVRKACAWALGEIGNATAVAALQAASTTDADASVRSIAKASAGRLN